MTDKIDTFIGLFEERMYEKCPFSTIEHVRNNKEEYVLFKIADYTRNILYRWLSDNISEEE